MLDLEEAQLRVLADVMVLGAERVSLEHAVGRVLADDVIAPSPLPPFDYSAMDGYAVELATAGEVREVVGESRAGGEAPPLLRGTAMRIFTGAPLPLGADAVVMQEETERTGDSLRLVGVPRAGDHVRRAGDDLASGATALVRGTRLRATHLPLLASLEANRPAVVRRPVVTILATGDELREPGAIARPGTIVETNGPALAAMARAIGATTRLLPIAPDDPARLRAALLDALDGADVVLTIGGVSVGDHDLVKPALASVGVDLDFWRVSIKPGKPLAVGRRGKTRILGLPGNPVSALVTFVLFGAPLLRALSGERSPLPKARLARLARELRHTPGRTELVRATLTYQDGAAIATPVTSQSSGSLVSIAWADALIVLPKDSAGAPAGSSVSILEL